MKRTVTPKAVTFSVRPHRALRRTRDRGHSGCRGAVRRLPRARGEGGSRRRRLNRHPRTEHLEHMKQTDASRRALRVARPDGAEIAAEVIGSAEHPVVLLVAGGESLHGLVAARVLRPDRGSRAAAWCATTSAAWARRRSVRPARAATGCRSPSRTRSRCSMPSARADAHWVGFSAGGWVAQLAALDHPDRVRALTLVSTSPTMFEADPDLPGATARMREVVGEPAARARLERSRLP